MSMLVRRMKIGATVHGMRSSFRMWAADVAHAPFDGRRAVPRPRHRERRSTGLSAVQHVGAASPNHERVGKLRQRLRRRQRRSAAPGDEPMTRGLNWDRMAANPGFYPTKPEPWLRAIALRQPFAWAVIYGGKDVENRSLNAPRQFKAAVGRHVFVHASKTMTRAEYEDAVEFMRKIGVACPHPDELQFGGVKAGCLNRARPVWAARSASSATASAERSPGRPRRACRASAPRSAITAGGSSDEGHEAARSDPSIEDGLDENDWKGFAHQTAVQGQRIQIVGDDIFVGRRPCRRGR